MGKIVKFLTVLELQTMKVLFVLNTANAKESIIANVTLDMLITNVKMQCVSESGATKRMYVLEMANV